MPMAYINLSIDDDLDKQFRSEVAKRLGMKKGNIKTAIEQAMRIWIENNEKTIHEL
jgi:hypothetical protein